jgi:uncharacterized protein YyaL (SSP411 family)
MANRLANETSPYLQQHADNPVDWHAWGPEALEQARAEDKPILLSIGYSACHWCHVMARESFEDPQIGALMNRDFINVKVDREERPDLDQVYQTAHQMMSQGSGGWPLTMFLSPDGTPFFGGTYFPKTARYGLPGFAQVLEGVAQLWREKRAEIREQDERVRGAFSRTASGATAAQAALDDGPIRASLQRLRETFDPQSGGFGQAPKFPRGPDLELCLRAYALRGDQTALDMAVLTLRRMCEGGIYDQLGGGFCRYSVDATWTIPHFEKMLYDNGHLLALLVDAWRATGDTVFERCVGETAAWLMREMQSPEGGYYSSLDADSEHEEGKFYVWERAEAEKLLEPDEFVVARSYWRLDRGPNFEGKHWHLRVASTLEDAARLAGVATDKARALLDSARAKLFAARERRIHPGRDEKVLVSWNALAILGMARAGRAFDRPEWVDSARRALAHIRSRMWRDGRLLATYKDGRAHLSAYLDDYAFLVLALLELLQCEYAQVELDFARALADVLLESFEDRAGGAFFFTANDHEALLYRPKPSNDSSLPSGNGVAAFALGRLALLTGDERYADAARRTVETFSSLLREYPAGCATLVQALDETLSPASTLVLRGALGALADWSRRLAREFMPGTLVVAIPVGANGLPPALDKPHHAGAITGWLCRGPVCLAPSNDLDATIAACKARDSV